MSNKTAVMERASKKKSVKRQRNDDCDAPCHSVSSSSVALTTLSDTRLMWLEAKSVEDLAAVEAFYRKWILARQSSTASTAAMTEEEVDVRNKLIMLLLQSGRSAESVDALKRLRYTARLASCVLDYPSPGTMLSSMTNREAEGPLPYAILDSALPDCALQRLRKALGPQDADYWVSHGYCVEPPTPYFSFVIDLRETPTGALGPLGVLIETVKRMSVKQFGEKALSQVRFAELWAHNRPHASGHQLHYDSDDEGHGGIRNPVVTSVCFLEGTVGGPTLMTNQHLGDSFLGTKGWLCHPQENRVLVFDGSVLHGVIPGKGVSPHPGSRRVTVMVALWNAIKIRCGSGPGSARPFPQEDDGDGDLPRWTQALTKWDQQAVTGCVARDASSYAFEAATELPQLWETVEGLAWPKTAPIPPYDAVFQGF